MKNTAFLTAEEESLYNDYLIFKIPIIKSRLNCTTDAANKAIRAILKKVREHKAFEERQIVRYDKTQTAINQAKFDGCFNYKIMSNF
jgi:hypothetical protein